MQALYDSQTNRLTRRGDHTGTPRLWTVTVWLTFEDKTVEKTLFKPAGKCQISDLASLIDEYNRSRIVLRNQQAIRTRWHAIAR